MNDHVIEHGLTLHSPYLDQADEVLRRLGGFEIAALAAERLCPGAAEWFLFAHRSKEPVHQAMLEALDARPLLDLGLRLGEGSGAAVAVPLLRLACALHNGMVTFEKAAVSQV